MRIELIPQPIHGADIIHPPRTADLPPQVLNVLINKIKISQIIRVIPPQMRRYRLPRQHPVLVDKEIQQQVEFFGCRIQQRIINARFESVGIQADLVELYDTRTAQVLPPVYGAYPRMQLRSMNRLGD